MVLDQRIRLGGGHFYCSVSGCECSMFDLGLVPSADVNINSNVECNRCRHSFDQHSTFDKQILSLDDELVGLDDEPIGLDDEPIGLDEFKEADVGIINKFKGKTIRELMNLGGGGFNKDQDTNLDIYLDTQNYLEDQTKFFASMSDCGIVSDKEKLYYTTKFYSDFLNINIEMILEFTIPANKTITINLPIIENEIPDSLGFIIDWGDSADLLVDNQDQSYKIGLSDISYGIKSHTYTSSPEDKVYIVKIFGLGIIGFGNLNRDEIDRNYRIYLTRVLSFGYLGHMMVSLLFAFAECINLKTVSDYLPANITKLIGIFYGCENLVGTGIGKWHMNNITDARYMFRGCTVFNDNLSDWELNSLVNASEMFSCCSEFIGGNLNKWRLNNLENAVGMFGYCCKFNGILVGWRLNKLKDASTMFWHCSVFNGDLSGWVLDSLINAVMMFVECLITDAHKPKHRLIYKHNLI